MIMGALERTARNRDQKCDKKYNTINYAQHQAHCPNADIMLHS